MASKKRDAYRCPGCGAGPEEASLFTDAEVHPPADHRKHPELSLIMPDYTDIYCSYCGHVGTWNEFVQEARHPTVKFERQEF